MKGEDGTLYVLTGCTAVGKTALALDWAEANEAEIVSCDSLLFYRGMDIGTAKPSASERERVSHHLIDIRDPGAPLDIAAYLDLAIEAVADIQSRGKKVLVTGGSGFYLKAFFGPVVDSVEVRPETRARAQAIEDESGLEGLQLALKSLDPDVGNQIDMQNPRRVIRALERCMESGMTVSELKAQFAEQSNALIRSSKKLVILERDFDELSARISARVEEMLERGLVEEVKRLRAAGLERNPSGAGAIGYRETLSFLDGEFSGGELGSRIAANTRRLAKKQRTWFRTQLPAGKTISLSERPTPDGAQLFK